ncbi:MAG: putative UDP-N-acetylmuramate:L-alanyl-gamma-D-glutamyl-meso-diaminopimelate ligase, partial [Pseudomonadota bacterium]
YDADQLKLAPDCFVVGNVVSRARTPQGIARYPLMEAILDAGAAYTSGPQWLGEHILRRPGRASHVLAVAGTHGKTTTTSMLAWVLQACGRDPGFLVGGVPLNFGTSARLGAAERQAGAPFVIEADEYDTAFFDKRSKFMHYRPRTAILNNLEFDHADIFDDLAAIERQFHHWVRTIPSQGRVVFNAEQESLKRVLQQGCWSQAMGFGLQHGEWRIEGPPEDFGVWHQGREVARVAWSVAGVHNQLNALAALVAADHLGVPVSEAAQALAGFENVRRRLEKKGVVNGVTVYDDFAHHPTAIHTTVDGLRRQVGQARIIAVFEPRSNTMKLGTMKSQLPWSLSQVDLAICHSGGLDWNAAEALAPMGERAVVAPTIDDAVRAVAAAARRGDHVLCMSNGGFGGIHGKILDALA